MSKRTDRDLRILDRIFYTAVTLLVMVLAMLVVASESKAEVICAEASNLNQVPIFEHNGVEWLDCESAQWLTGMAPSAHLGPVFPDPAGPARFMPAPSCTGGDGFTREENSRLWMHDHGGVRDLPGTEPDPSYPFSCPDVYNPNWSKFGRRTHTYNTSEGMVFQGRNGAWCVDESDEPFGLGCDPDSVSGVVTHQQHRGPLLCQIKTPTHGGEITVHSGCGWAGCVGEEGKQRVRAYDVYGKVDLLGEFPAGNPLLNTVTWEGHKPYIFLDGKQDTPWVALREICVEVGCAPSPDFNGDGVVTASDFTEGFLPMYETGECSASDFTTWFLPAFRAGV